MDKFKFYNKVLSETDLDTPRHFLFLQGPVGPFFKELGNSLKEAGHKVTRINCNAGDWWDWHGKDTLSFKAPLNEWPGFLKNLYTEHGITDLFVYGDCRPLHRIAIESLKQLGIRVFVFEEGYIRPNYVTLCENGVNAYSELPRDPNFYQTAKEIEYEKPLNMQNASKKMYGYAFLYYFVLFLGQLFYPYYQKHRIWLSRAEAISWVKRWLNQYKRTRNALQAQKKLYQKREKFYLAILQLCGDSQIQTHSRFNNMAEYIETVIRSFARFAPKDTKLVFKNHPLDNGLSDLENVTLNLAREHDIEDRIIFIDGGRLKGLAQAALSAICINSTAAFSPLHRGTPLIALGDAIFNFEGLTFQKSLNEFWAESRAANSEIYKKFRDILTLTTQINGNYFDRLGRKTLCSNIVATNNIETLEIKAKKDLLNETVEVTA